jgi:NADH:ubiquinone oxidoreductase subunit 4 (subunit M)
VADLTGRELAALAPVALACLALGVFPKMFFDTVKPDLKVVTAVADRARARAASEVRGQRSEVRSQRSADDL